MSPPLRIADASRRGSIALALALALPVHVLAADAKPDAERPSGVSTRELRTTTSLDQNWKFIQDDKLTDDAALAASGTDWHTVNLPHTWNAHDAASLNSTKPYKRGVGWYKLEFDAPAVGARHWLEVGAASMVADVWLNGQKLGQHKGAFTAFRFDVTNVAGRSKTGNKNVLLIKTDNSAPLTDQDRTAIIPLAGDFNVSGGLYRRRTRSTSNSGTWAGPASTPPRLQSAATERR
jgi:beta-galactosidase